MKTPSEEYVRAVVDVIPYGKRNAISRRMLASRVGMNDRNVRACIEAARRDGHFIISSNEGYYLATEPEEVERQYRIDHARALSILARLTPMRRYLRAAGVDVK
ncbi:MAG: hypothetical protein IJU66_00065 [Oscillospiraceae bacterium]|nr:hypothetical protein [Oscillospiraceae bacterium]